MTKSDLSKSRFCGKCVKEEKMMKSDERKKGVAQVSWNWIVSQKMTKSELAVSEAY